MGGSRCWEQAAAGAQRGHVMDRTGDRQQGTDRHGLAAGLCTGTPSVHGPPPAMRRWGTQGGSTRRPLLFPAHRLFAAHPLLALQTTGLTALSRPSAQPYSAAGMGVAVLGCTQSQGCMGCAVMEGGFLGHTGSPSPWKHLFLTPMQHC